MSLRSRADAILGISLLAAAIMLLAGLASSVSFIAFVSDGEISADFFVMPCIVLGGFLLVLALAFTVPVARVLLGSEAEAARRAAYFSVLFPVLLLSFLLSTPRTGFTVSFTFAFPLFLLGCVAYPYSAGVMRRWVRTAEMENLLMVRCFRCAYVFEMHRQQPRVMCPQCGQVNMNPEMTAREGGPPEGAPPPGPVSP